MEAIHQIYDHQNMLISKLYCIVPNGTESYCANRHCYVYASCTILELSPSPLTYVLFYGLTACVCVCSLSVCIVSAILSIGVILIHIAIVQNTTFW